MLLFAAVRKSMMAVLCIGWLAMLLLVPAHAQAERSSPALPGFSVAVDGLTIHGELQPLAAGGLARELLLQLQQQQQQDSSATQDLPKDMQLAVSMDGVAAQARALGEGRYSLMMPVSLRGQVPLEIHISNPARPGESQRVPARLDMGAAGKPSRGPGTIVNLMGVLTLALFFLSGFLAWREHRGRKAK